MENKNTASNYITLSTPAWNSTMSNVFNNAFSKSLTRESAQSIEDQKSLEFQMSVISFFTNLFTQYPNAEFQFIQMTNDIQTLNLFKKSLEHLKLALDDKDIKSNIALITTQKQSSTPARRNLSWMASTNDYLLYFEDFRDALVCEDRIESCINEVQTSSKNVALLLQGGNMSNKKSNYVASFNSVAREVFDGRYKSKSERKDFQATYDFPQDFLQKAHGFCTTRKAINTLLGSTSYVYDILSAFLIAPSTVSVLYLDFSKVDTQQLGENNFALSDYDYTQALLVYTRDGASNRIKNDLAVEKRKSMLKCSITFICTALLFTLISVIGSKYIPILNFSNKQFVFALTLFLLVFILILIDTSIVRYSEIETRQAKVLAQMTFAAASGKALAGRYEVTHF